MMVTMIGRHHWWWWWWWTIWWSSSWASRSWRLARLFKHEMLLGHYNNGQVTGIRVSHSSGSTILTKIIKKPKMTSRVKSENSSLIGVNTANYHHMSLEIVYTSNLRDNGFGNYSISNMWHGGPGLTHTHTHRERDTHTHTHTHTQRETHTKRETHTERERKRQREYGANNIYIYIYVRRVDWYISCKLCIQHLIIIHRERALLNLPI